MTAALVLIGYAVAMATVGAAALQRARWPLRTPRLGVLAWQAATASVLLASILAGLVLVLSMVPLSTDLSMLLDACVMAVQAMYSTPGGAATGSLGGLLAIGIAARTVAFLVAELTETRRDRVQQRQVLALIGRPDPNLDAVVLEHDAVAAYCLPGRPGRVVVTSAAVSGLPAKELRAVLDHEAAHLRAHHGLVLAAARAIERAFPRVPLFRIARDEIGDLVEMLADDVAARRHGPVTVASALVTLAEMATPAGALAAGGYSACRRARRLLENPPPPGGVRVLLGGPLVLALLALPLVIALAPVVAAIPMECCAVTY